MAKPHHRIKYNTHERIEQQPSSLEGTLPLKTGASFRAHKFNWDEHAAKLKIVESFYNTMPCSKEQMFKILRQWPSKSMRDIIGNNQVLELRGPVYMIGEVLNGRVHGPGLILYNKKSFYEGQLQNNHKHGYGIEQTEDALYIGSFINNKPQGNGTLYSKNKEEYHGYFVAGVKHGQGKWSLAGDQYIGEWKNNKPDGSGVFITPISRYEGEVRSGLKHGRGTEVFKNGDKFVGMYVNGRPEGEGEYHWENTNAHYVGGFKNGLRHGKGVWKKSTETYQGQYLNDRKNGFGIFTWSSGSIYKGNYFSDLRHGYGEMFWTDGTWYKGEWKNGVQHGQGLLFDGQKTIKATFQNNQIVAVITPSDEPSQNDRKNSSSIKLPPTNSNTTKYAQGMRNSRVVLYESRDQPAHNQSKATKRSYRAKSHSADVHELSKVQLPTINKKRRRTYTEVPAVKAASAQKSGGKNRYFGRAGSFERSTRPFTDTDNQDVEKQSVSHFKTTVKERLNRSRVCASPKQEKTLEGLDVIVWMNRRGTAYMRNSQMKKPV